MWRGGTLAVCVALAASALACGSGGKPSGPTPAALRPRSTATIAFVEPAPGSQVPAPTVHVKITLTGGTIVNVTSTNLKPDEGHVHLVLDGTLVSMTYGLEQDVPNVSKGSHLLQAEFVASDHAPFDPRVLTTTTFTVT